MTVSTPKVGQVWVEMDPRQERYVRILMVDEVGGLCRLQKCDINGNAVATRVTTAQLRRFNGQRSGYSLHRFETI